MTHQLPEIFIKPFVSKNLSNIFILKKRLDEVKNIYPTFITVLLRHLHSCFID
jgi:hypothetical protein